MEWFVLIKLIPIESSELISVQVLLCLPGGSIEQSGVLYKPTGSGCMFGVDWASVSIELGSLSCSPVRSGSSLGGLVDFLISSSELLFLDIGVGVHNGGFSIFM